MSTRRHQRQLLTTSRAASESDPLLAARSLRDWYELLARDAPRALELVQQSLPRGRAAQSAGRDREDLIQEVLNRLLATRKRWADEADEAATIMLDAWVGGIARNLSREAQRRAARDEPTHNRPDGNRSIDGDCDHVDSEEISLRWVNLLPLPYRSIAILQYWKGATRKEITAHLQGHRAIGEDEALRLIKETHRMLRYIIEGGDARTKWPRRYGSNLVRRWDALNS